MLAATAFVLSLLVQDAETVSAGNLILQVPPGWTHERRAEGLFLRPGDLRDGEAYVVVIPPGTKTSSNLAETFEKSWAQAAGGKTTVKKAPPRELKTDGGADGLMSAGILETERAARLVVGLAVFKAGDRSEAVLALTEHDHVFQRYSGAFGTLLRGLRFKTVEFPSYELLISMGYTEVSGKTTVYVLFKDGTWLEGLPEEGLDDLTAESAKKQFPDRCGTHETKDKTTTLKRGERTETLKQGADGSWRSAENAQFLKVPACSGFRVDGRYAVHGGSGILLLKADGGFENREGVPAAPASGGYEIYNNTLYLTGADGKTLKVGFLLLPKTGDPNPEFVLAAARWLRREP